MTKTSSNLFRVTTILGANSTAAGNGYVVRRIKHTKNEENNTEM
jgi:hypothetical protein